MAGDLRYLGDGLVRGGADTIRKTALATVEKAIEYLDLLGEQRLLTSDLSDQPIALVLASDCQAPGLPLRLLCNAVGKSLAAY